MLGRGLREIESKRTRAAEADARNGKWAWSTGLLESASRRRRII